MASAYHPHLWLDSSFESYTKCSKAVPPPPRHIIEHTNLEILRIGDSLAIYRFKPLSCVGWCTRWVLRSGSTPYVVCSYGMTNILCKPIPRRNSVLKGEVRTLGEKIQKWPQKWREIGKTDVRIQNHFSIIERLEPRATNSEPAEAEFLGSISLLSRVPAVS